MPPPPTYLSWFFHPYLNLAPSARRTAVHPRVGLLDPLPGSEGMHLLRRHHQKGLPRPEALRHDRPTVQPDPVQASLDVVGVVPHLQAGRHAYSGAGRGGRETRVSTTVTLFSSLGPRMIGGPARLTLRDFLASIWECWVDSFRYRTSMDTSETANSTTTGSQKDFVRIIAKVKDKRQIMQTGLERLIPM